MCLTTDKNEIKVAKDDIIVFKNLNYIRSKWFIKELLGFKIAMSSVQNHIYKRGILQPYITLRLFAHYRDPNIFTVEEGYHSNVEEFGSNAVFIIPKGTKYVEGWNNGYKSIKNYVSETIIYKGRL